MDYNNEDKKINDIVDKLMSYYPNWGKMKKHLNMVKDFAINYVDDWKTMCEDDIYFREYSKKYQL